MLSITPEWAKVIWQQIQNVISSAINTKCCPPGATPIKLADVPESQDKIIGLSEKLRRFYDSVSDGRDGPDLDSPFRWDDERVEFPNFCLAKGQCTHPDDLDIVNGPLRDILQFTAEYRPDMDLATWKEYYVEPIAEQVQLATEWFDSLARPGFHKGGRKSEWDDLVKLSETMKAADPTVTDTIVLASYCERYPKRKKPTVDNLRDARINRTTRHVW